VLAIIHSAPQPDVAYMPTGEGSDPSRVKPSGTSTPGWAIIRGVVPRCGQLPSMG